MDPSSSIEERATDPRDEGARDRVISEEQFLGILAKAEPQKELFSFYDVAPSDPEKWKKHHCFVLLKKTHAFETFLDDYHARSNRRFVYFAELNASIRNFAEVAHVLNHLDKRFSAYDVRFGVSDHEHGERLWNFRTELTAAILFANSSIVKLLIALRDEAVKIGLAVPVLKPLGGNVPEDRGRLRLPHDVDQEQVDAKGGAVAVILNGFLQITERVKKLGDALPRRDGPALRQFVKEQLPETQARIFKAAVHNLQSAYDTHVKPTRLHDEVAELRRFRGHVSLALHLLEVANHLVHFYERHESDELQGMTKARIAALVDPEEVLKQAIQFAAGHAIDVVLHALPIVQGLLPRFVQQQTLELEVPDGGILHARPLSLIVSVVRKHGKPVEMVIDGDATSASSLMGLILFIGRHPDARKVAFRGDRDPLDHLKLLFKHGLGERGLDELPAELAYLRQN